MLGLMQNHPLLISSLIEHAAVAHPDREVVSWTLDGPPRRLTYVEVNRRAKRMAQALSAMGVTPGDRVATLAWNTHRHVELLFAVSGMGAVLHTVNPRLFPEQLEYIINHAADQVLLFDPDLLPLMEQLAPRLKTAKAFVALSDEERMPTSTKVPLLCYETLAAREDAGFRWPRLDENTASSLCYTSGTTGNPKGVLYSHRSTLLHTMALCMVDCVGLSGADTILLAAPMFHVNGWGKPYAAALCGARLVLPGPAPDSARLYGLMRDERATVAAAVPTVWLMLQQYIDAHGLDPASELELERVFVGGTAVPRAVIDMFRERFHADVLHAWGMTETSPVATVCRPLPKHSAASAEQRTEIQLKQGRAPFGVDLRIVDSDGTTLPHDGKSAGHLLVRGHWIASGYYGSEPGSALDAEGWFDSGDIATIDADGYVQITDRSKDVIKSGGEWISSIQLENAVVGHSAVAEAAAIGLPHPIWQERPLLIVVTRSGRCVTEEELRSYLADKVAKWWLPEKIVFVTQLPRTATGKVQKATLREMFKDHRF